jgi:hypothetical protein
MRQNKDRPHMSSLILAMLVAWLIAIPAPTIASHQGHEHRSDAGSEEHAGPAYSVPGLPFPIILSSAMTREEGEQAVTAAVVQTVIDAFAILLEQRREYPRFDESVNKNLLTQTVIEPRVISQDGKEYPLLVARTKEAGHVRLLISASSLAAKGLVNHPDQFAPILAREFQWVISKADTAPKPKTVLVERDLIHAPIREDKAIQGMTGDERTQLLQRLFDTYLKTVDDQKSLQEQAFYEPGSTTLVPPTLPDSTIHFYEIRVRQALQRIVRDPWFMERTPQAVKSLLNGKIWNVAFVKIDQRDWATRTRVLSQDKAIVVGDPARQIQPAALLINTYRTAAPDDPFYAETKGLPMGALSPDQLARVIAMEIQQNITEKSMTGHVSQDALTAPK